LSAAGISLLSPLPHYPWLKLHGIRRRNTAIPHTTKMSEMTFVLRRSR